MISGIKLKLIKFLLKGYKVTPLSDAMYELIDEENQKDENEIRCWFIDALVEASSKIPGFIIRG